LLNPQQNKAVSHIYGPLLVLAGAGSGKTRVVTHRIAHLLESGVSPSQILAVTFTNRAALEMKRRLEELCPFAGALLACTFHSLGSRILRESIHLLGYLQTFSIYDEDDSEKLLKTCLGYLGIAAESGTVRDLRHQISTSKNELLSPDQVTDALLKKVYGLYQSKLKECNALDFDDLLYLTVQLLQTNETARALYQNRWQFVLIDEYQDTNLAQYTLTKILVEKHQNLFAVGDPDQSIYSWRGARYQNILNFERDFANATVITLDQNYRSTNTILRGANGLIAHNAHRLHKNLWSSLGDGSKIVLYVAYNEKQEAIFVADKIRTVRHSLNDVAIFYRTNAQSRPFEDALLARRIPYVMVGGVSFYERKEIKDILAYLRLLTSNADLVSFLRTINAPKRGLGASTLEKIVAGVHIEQKEIIPFCEELLNRSDFKLGPKQKEGLRKYLETIASLKARRSVVSICDLIKGIIAETGYLAYLQEDPETFEDRKENLDELLGKAVEWEEESENPSLEGFLEELTLRISPEKSDGTPAVKMMTLHNSKGLEFLTVFFGGLEEDLLPHINSRDDASAVEEERRLCYVGMTRAREQLYLTASTYRYMWGTARLMRPSRFLQEIPSDCVTHYGRLREMV
jgi:DNA helicase-2/ATP-dependent DNA helicase PcrA